MRNKDETTYVIMARVITPEGHLFLDRDALISPFLRYGRTVFHYSDGDCRLAWYETLSEAQADLTKIVEHIETRDGAKGIVRIVAKINKEVECAHIT